MRNIPLPVVVPVRGVSFHQDVVRAVEVGQVLEVVAEPDNEFDANACVVRTGGEVLGHLPREIACRLRHTGDLCWHAEVVEVLHGSKATGLRIRLLAPVASQPREVALPASSEEQARSVGAPSVVPEERTVLARSGRRLGLLIGAADGSVTVRTDDGRTVSYPETLVVVGE